MDFLPLQPWDASRLESQTRGNEAIATGAVALRDIVSAHKDRAKIDYSIILFKFKYLDNLSLMGRLSVLGNQGHINGKKVPLWSEKKGLYESWP